MLVYKRTAVVISLEKIYTEGWRTVEGDACRQEGHIGFVVDFSKTPVDKGVIYAVLGKA